MNVLLIDNGTTLLTKLEALIPGHTVVQTWREFTDEQVENADLIVLSGGSLMQLVGNEAEFEREMALVRDTRKPVLGICFGCELITRAFGGTLAHMPEAHKGKRTITLVPFLASIEVYENHQWVIDQMPAGFSIMALSDAGPELIRHMARPIYGMQFHPENLVDEAQGDELFQAFLTHVLEGQGTV